MAWLRDEHKNKNGSSLLEDIGKALFEKKPKIEIAKPIKDCRNCTFYRPLEKFYGYCGKTNNNLAYNNAPLCPDYLAFGEVTVSALDAGVLTSGLLDLARIPRLDLTKIPLGTSGYFLKGQGASDSIYALLAAGDIPNLDASKITSGLLDLARIPRLDLTKIPLGTSGYFLKGQGTSDSIYALLAAGDIPSLDASKITTGTFGDARLDLSALTQDINITKATPTIKLQRTTGSPTIEFNDATHNFQVIMHVTAQELRILYDGGYIFQMDKTGKITKGLILTWDLASKMSNLATIWDKTTKIGSDGLDLSALAQNILPASDDAYNIGASGYRWALIKTHHLSAYATSQGETVIYCEGQAGNIGTSVAKFYAGYFSNLPACPLISIDPKKALDLVSKLEEPQYNDKDKRYEWKPEQLPEEALYIAEDGSKHPEAFRIIGFLLQTVKELTAKVEELTAKVEKLST